MNGTYFATAFYLIGFLLLFGGFFFWKKTTTAQPAILWLPLTGILFECFLTFVAAVICLIKIPTNVVTLGIFCYAAAAFFWFRILRKKERQRYTVSIYDLIFAALFLIAVLWISNIRFGLTTFDWSYRTVDPSARYREAMEFVNDEYVRHMFFAQLQNGMLIEVLSPAVHYDYYYKIYVLGDILQLYLNGLMFYGVARHISERYGSRRFGKLVAIIAAFFYALGYVLNSMIWGFTYLGMSLYLAMALLALVALYLEKEFTDRYTPILLLMLVCTAVFQCYVLFMPVLYLSVALPILLDQYREKKLFSFDTVKKGLGIFLLPVIFGLVYTYLEVFVQDDITVGSAFSAEGAIYRDLYSNFLFFLPVAVIGFLFLLKEKRNGFLVWFTPVFTVFMLSMFIISYRTRRVSTYYFFKDYYLLWLLVWLLIVYAMNRISVQGRVMAGLYLCSWAFVASLYFFGIENRIELRNERFVKDNKSMLYNDLLAFNWGTILTPHFSADRMDLNHHAYALLNDGTADDPLAIVSIQEETYLFESMTGQMLTDFEYWKDNDMERYFSNIDALCDYVCVYVDSPVYQGNIGFFDNMEIVYENPAGFLAKVHP